MAVHFAKIAHLAIRALLSSRLPEDVRPAQAALLPGGSRQPSRAPLQLPKAPDGPRLLHPCSFVPFIHHEVHHHLADLRRKTATKDAEGEHHGRPPQLSDPQAALASVTLQALRRDMAKKVDAGMTEEEVKAERSRVMSERRLGSVGGPRFEGEPDPSADVEPYFTRPQLAAVRSASLIVPVLDPTRVIGKPNISTRLNQLALLVQDHNEAELDGNDSPAPHVRDMDVGDERYFRWFLSRPKGAEMRRSAGQIGRPQPQRSAEEEEALKESYVARGPKLAERSLAHQARLRDEQGISNVKEITLEDALRLLAGTSFKKAQGEGSRRGVVFFHCTACAESFVGSLDKSKHICFATGTPVHLPPSDPKLVRNRPLYPAALLALAGVQGAELDDLLRTTGLVQTSASAHVSSLELDMIPSSFDSDPQIYFLPSTPSSVRHDMAIDALVFASYDAPNRLDSDDFWWEGNPASVFEHVATGGELPFRQCICRKSDCDSHQYVVKTTTKATQQPPQHSCGPVPPRDLSTGRIPARPRPRPAFEPASEDVKSTFGLPLDLVRRIVFAVSTPGDALAKTLRKTSTFELTDVLGWSVE